MKIPALLSRTRDSKVVLKPYVREMSDGRRKLVYGLSVAGLAFFGLIYGFYYALTTPFLLVPFMVPIALLIVLVIWVLPDSKNPPLKAMETSFLGVMLALILWPNYLAIALPGLPWITFIRLFSFPMALFLLIGISTSQSFRSELKRVLDAQPVIWKFLIVFVFLQFLTIGFSKEVFGSLNRVTIQQVNWTAIFFVSCFVFSKPGRVEKWTNLFWFAILTVALVAVWESRIERLPWANHIPSFLKVDTQGSYLEGIIRSATGEYRAKGTSSTPLGLAELMALAMPFMFHFALNDYALRIRVLAAACLPLLFFVILKTDSRLGVVGSLTSLIAYGGLWSFMRWRGSRTDILGPAIVFSFPPLLALLIAATFVSHRFHVMIWGDGAQQASDEARGIQVHDGLVKLLQNPLGYGNGQAAEVIGYRGAGGMLTIDNYLLTIALDYGVVGFVIFFTFIILGIYKGLELSIATAGTKDREMAMVAPLTVVLVNFIVIKSVFSQEENHPLIFMVMGMIVALAYRHKLAALVSGDHRNVAEKG